MLTLQSRRDQNRRPLWHSDWHTGGHLGAALVMLLTLLLLPYLPCEHLWDGVIHTHLGN